MKKDYFDQAFAILIFFIVLATVIGMIHLFNLERACTARGGSLVRGTLFMKCVQTLEIEVQ